MSAAAPMSTPWRLPAWLVDTLVCLLVLATSFARLPQIDIDRSALGWVATLLPVPLLAFRRRLPWPVLIGCALCLAAVVPGGVLSPFALLPTAIALYSVGVASSRRTTVIAAAALLAVTIVVSWIVTGVPLHPTTFLVAGTFGFAAASADAVRTRRAYIQAIMARAVHAEQTREAEASRRVAEDRLRIARDLHDTVAHQISVISLNAGVASSSLERDPAQARAALGSIREASRRVLTEIGSLLSTLRLPGDQSPTAPTPGLATLDLLVADLAASGFRVTVRREGDIGPLPPAQDAVAYQVLREALTNAVKHGSAPHAHVLLAIEAGSLRIVVTNPADETGAGRESGTGHGLAGLRERVASVSGRVLVGAETGIHRLEVDLPLELGVPAPESLA